MRKSKKHIPIRWIIYTAIFWAIGGFPLKSLEAADYSPTVIQDFTGPKIATGPGVGSLRLEPVEVEPPTIPDITVELNKKIIGEEKSMSALATAWHMHVTTQKLNESLIAEGRSPISKTNVLLIGPTGSGKTASVELLAKIVGVPFYAADASIMTRTGYVGDSADSVILGLLRNSNYNVEQAEKGMIFIDEIDKKASGKTHLESEVAGKDVQSEFLKLLEGKKVLVSIPAENGGGSVEVDTSKILFISGGAFSGISKKAKVTPEDIVNYGFSPEFVGRFGRFIQLQGMTEEKLFHILKSPHASPIENALLLLERGYHVRVTFHDSVLSIISNHALKLGTGARGLKSLVDQIVEPILTASEMLRGEHIYIDEAYMQRNLPNLLPKKKSGFRELAISKLRQMRHSVFSNRFHAL
jgi:ATP-dependent Clp protease ATP-binding subunit ClpX